MSTRLEASLILYIVAYGLVQRSPTSLTVRDSKLDPMRRLSAGSLHDQVLMSPLISDSPSSPTLLSVSRNRTHEMSLRTRLT
jgi:hypothetical protein